MAPANPGGALPGFLGQSPEEFLAAVSTLTTERLKFNSSEAEKKMKATKKKKKSKRVSGE